MKTRNLKLQLPRLWLGRPPLLRVRREEAWTERASGYDAQPRRAPAAGREAGAPPQVKAAVPLQGRGVAVVGTRRGRRQRRQLQQQQRRRRRRRRRQVLRSWRRRSPISGPNGRLGGDGEKAESEGGIVAAAGTLRPLPDPPSPARRGSRPRATRKLTRKSVR